MKTITITFSKGETKVEAHGFKGQGCQAATKQIEEALGITKSVEKKPEFHSGPQLTTRTANYQNINS